MLYRLLYLNHRCYMLNKNHINKFFNRNVFWTISKQAYCKFYSESKKEKMKDDSVVGEESKEEGLRKISNIEVDDDISESRNRNNLSSFCRSLDGLAGVKNVNVLSEKKLEKKKRSVLLIEDEEECENEVSKILEAGTKEIAADFEGVALGRFGRLCIAQVATAEGVTLIFDCLKEKIVLQLKRLLESDKILKVVHDCREDNAALYNQFNIYMKNVYDTQVAHTIVCGSLKKELFQISLHELIDEYLHCFFKKGEESSASNSNREDRKSNNKLAKSVKEIMSKDASVWFRRPLTKDLLKYAIFGVSYLLKVHEIMNFRVKEALVIERTRRYLAYSCINLSYDSANSIAQRGNIVEAMLASKTSHSLVFKLNCGRQGMVCTPSAIKRFEDVQIGDIVHAQVSTISIDGGIVYLDRYDPLFNFWDLQSRPRGRHSTSNIFEQRSFSPPCASPQSDENFILHTNVHSPHAETSPNIDPYLSPHISTRNYDDDV